MRPQQDTLLLSKLHMQGSELQSTMGHGEAKPAGMEVLKREIL